MAIQAYSHGSRAGVFTIAFRPSTGRWHVLFAAEDISGAHTTAQRALDDLRGGHVDAPPGCDPSALGLADEIGDWKPSAVPGWWR